MRYYIKDIGIHWVHLGRKQKATGFVYIKGSPYCDTEVSSQIRSCLHGATINADPKIGGGGNLGLY